MYTLKIAQTGSSDDSITWICGVVTVHRIDMSPKAEAATKWETYRRDCDNLVDHTRFLPDDRDVTLLSVVLAGGHDLYVVVGRAWLLGPDGGTIERVAP